ncbi:hypothetical protein JCM17823_18980 [Halorubrum gandharaense]
MCVWHPNTPPTAPFPRATTARSAPFLSESRAADPSRGGAVKPGDSAATGAVSAGVNVQEHAVDGGRETRLTTACRNRYQPATHVSTQLECDFRNDNSRC